MTDLARAGYSGTPLPKKLGIKPGAVVALVGAPDDFEQTLGELPDGTVLRRHARGRWDLAIWFVTSRRDMERRIERMSPPEGGGLWIAWPKKAAGTASDLTESVVREVALAAGLVDHKVCAIDATWSGLRFAVRKQKAPRGVRPRGRARTPPPSLPKDVAQALEAAGLLDIFRAQPPSHQREHLRYIDEAKRADTRARRIARTVERIGRGGGRGKSCSRGASKSTSRNVRNAVRA